MVTRVKICGLRRAEDVLIAVQEGADAVGFVLEPTSPRCIPFQTADVLSILTGPYCTSVAVYGRANGPFPKTDAVQAVEFTGMPQAPQKKILAVRPRPGDTIESLYAKDHDWDAMVLDAYSPDAFGGTGNKVDWHFAAEAVQKTRIPVILAGGLTPDNVAEAISLVRPYAVDVSSGVESAPGIKDPYMIRDFIAAARFA